MSEQQDPSHQPLGINSWLEDELYSQYKHDRRTVDAEWAKVFEADGQAAPTNGAAAGKTLNGSHTIAGNGTAAVPQPPAFEPGPADHLVPLRGAAARIAENMTASLSMPVATSQRVVAVKVIDENRRAINEFRSAQGQSKVSYTHLIAYAIVKAVETVPSLNHAYAETEGAGYRVVRDQVNIGLAVDVAGKNGARSLVVPNIKGAQAMDFSAFLAGYDELVNKARTNKLTVPDFQGTTISLTNPGTVGTTGSTPRLMPGQGAIIATGAIDYPPEYRGVPEQIRVSMGLSKVMMMTCTYDHRVIQGAESGTFLGRIQSLLEGEDKFYEQIFSSLGMTQAPIHWQSDATPVAIAPEVDPAKYAGVEMLKNAFRSRGHLEAKLDPLGLCVPKPHADLDLAQHGLSIWDLDRTYGNVTLRKTVEKFRKTYCGTIGVEYMHIANPTEREWIRQRIEDQPAKATAEQKKHLLRTLIEATGFESFLHTRFMGHKRFSAEGAESSLAILEEMLADSARSGAAMAIIGMAHRGRLTVLANLAGKSMTRLFSEFDGDIDPDTISGSGDVKYHLGARNEREFDGKKITVSMAFNPSHLEAVNPVIEGLARAEQDLLGDTKRERVVPIVVHGDAAVVGQGVVAETVNLSQIEGYKTGGTLHLIINNQIGFTAEPPESRTSQYCSDIALSIQAPVFHVNGDDPEACLRVTQLACEYRRAFKKDVFIDMVCYRRHGHNEGDDPSFTQPLMYRQIKVQKPISTLYADRLVAEGVVSAEEVAGFRKGLTDKFNAVFDEAHRIKDELEYEEVEERETLIASPVSTGVDAARLNEVIDRITTFPADFHLYPKLKGFIEKRREAMRGAPADWGLAEALAFGTLALEGKSVRLTGQDSSRGTFTQRHVEYSDAENGQRYIPLQHLSPTQARFEVYDSPLSEYATTGFEFGYTTADPSTLVLWEGQFGDFVNGAQIMIDQFISTSEAKWGQPNGLVMLLPHGNEGQGPEHTSARIERFLQLCGENNMQVCNCSTPAQYFHLLRRQMYGGVDGRGVRKPLIIFTPKSILRHPRAISPLPELASGSFHEILAEGVADPSAITKVLVCSGKVYYDLLAARDERKASHVAIVRVEQIYPFASEQFEGAIGMYPATAEVVWVQDESRNMGAYRFVEERMQPILNKTNRQLRYAGRPESASPAAGSLKRHQFEQVKLIAEAFAPTTLPKPRTRLVRRKKQG
jgi:2-oxoglutarate dehydrogenase E1 component